jgi:hypothetical protein
MDLITLVSAVFPLQVVTAKQYFKALKCTFPLHCCIVTGYGTSAVQKVIVLLHLDGLMSYWYMVTGYGISGVQKVTVPFHQDGLMSYCCMVTG